MLCVCVVDVMDVCVFCLYCEASSCRCWCMGSVSVSSCSMLYVCVLCASSAVYYVERFALTCEWAARTLPSGSAMIQESSGFSHILLV